MKDNMLLFNIVRPVVQIGVVLFGVDLAFHTEGRLSKAYVGFCGNALTLVARGAVAVVGAIMGADAAVIALSTIGFGAAALGIVCAVKQLTSNIEKISMGTPTINEGHKADIGEPRKLIKTHNIDKEDNDGLDINMVKTLLAAGFNVEKKKILKADAIEASKEISSFKINAIEYVLEHNNQAKSALNAVNNLKIEVGLVELISKTIDCLTAQPDEIIANLNGICGEAGSWYHANADF